MKKLNVGCGNRVADGWINIDFHSHDPRVIRSNLLKGLPYPDSCFDAVYASHVLEHFTREQARRMLREACRVLRPNGILRIIVPDLEGSCREYLRILALPDSNLAKSAMHEWISLELLDQLVRSVPGGDMGPFKKKLEESGDEELMSYVRTRTNLSPSTAPGRTSIVEKLRQVTPQRVVTKMTYCYLKAVGCLIPRQLRDMVLVGTDIGERHRWMYDQYGLRRMLQAAGFSDCQTVSHSESAMPGFKEDLLDCHPDGSAYKKNSIYMEGRKKAVE